MLANKEHAVYGYELIKEAKIRCSTVYDTLARFEKRGFITSVEPIRNGGRTQIPYRLSSCGMVLARQAKIEKEFDEWNVVQKESLGN